jgi:hypothetical protein
LRITGARRTALTAAIEVFLELRPLQLQLESEARAGIYRIYCSDKCESKSDDFGHTYLTQGMKEVPALQLGTDKMMPRRFNDKLFAIRFTERRE